MTTDQLPSAPPMPEPSLDEPTTRRPVFDTSTNNNPILYVLK